MAGRQCEFSESTFAFSFTENIWRRAYRSIQFVPIFPTLRQEGRMDGGYDLLLRFGATPVMFQFKVPDYIRRRSGEHRNQFQGPFYRFKLMPRRVSDQHQALLNHERAGIPVRYASPRFHLVRDLNSLFAGGNIPANSKMIPPSVIGPLPDMDDHHFDYDPRGSQHLICSKPISGEGDHSFEALLHALQRPLSDQKNPETALSTLNHFIGQATESVKSLKTDFPFQELGEIHPVLRCAWLSQALDCAFFLAIPGQELRSEQQTGTNR